MNFGDPNSGYGTLGNKRARKLIAGFLNKVIRLGLHRTSELCDRLDLQPAGSRTVLVEASSFSSSSLSDLNQSIN